jgi:hypothetical protein
VLSERQQRRLLVEAFKDRPCEKCGRSFPPFCMDAHHARGIKLFDISEAWPGRGSSATSRSLSNYLGRKPTALDTELELAKCDLLCACCHRIVQVEERVLAKSAS